MLDILSMHMSFHPITSGSHPRITVDLSLGRHELKQAYNLAESSMKHSQADQKD